MNKVVFLLMLAEIVVFQSRVAYAADAVFVATSLCSKNEVTIFSCSLKYVGAGNFPESAGALSICSAGDNSSGNAYYKWKKGEDVPEFVYPEQPIPIGKAFSFTSHNSPNSDDNYELMSFSRDDANYDVVIPADIESYQRETNFAGRTFAGQEVTKTNNQLNIYECDRKSMVANLEPIKKMLHVQKEGRFSDSFPFVKVTDAPFIITRKEGTDAGGFKTSIAYPVVNNATIDDEIKGFVNCYPEDDMYSHAAGSECSRSVSAKIVDDKFLMLRFESYNYAAGTPHGYGYSKTSIYLEHNGAWLNIKPLDLFIDSTYCKSNIGTMLYRQLRPIGFSSLMENDEGIFNGAQNLLENAEISLAAKGVEFGYQQYQLGGYIPPAPVLIPWKNLESCLRQPVLAH